MKHLLLVLGILSMAGCPTDPAAPNLVSAPPSWVYSTTVINHASTPKVFTITNNGGSATTGITASITGANPTDFTITGYGCVTDGVVAPGATCTIAIEFTPKSDFLVTLGATLNVRTTYGSTSLEVSLSGYSTY